MANIGTFFSLTTHRQLLQVVQQQQHKFVLHSVDSLTFMSQFVEPQLKCDHADKQRKGHSLHSYKLRNNASDGGTPNAPKLENVSVCSQRESLRNWVIVDKDNEVS